MVNHSCLCIGREAAAFVGISNDWLHHGISKLEWMLVQLTRAVRIPQLSSSTIPCLDEADFLEGFRSSLVSHRWLTLRMFHFHLNVQRELPFGFSVGTSESNDVVGLFDRSFSEPRGADSDRCSTVNHHVSSFENFTTTVVQGYVGDCALNFEHELLSSVVTSISFFKVWFKNVCWVVAAQRSLLPLRPSVVRSRTFLSERHDRMRSPSAYRFSSQADTLVQQDSAPRQVLRLTA